MKQPPHSSSTRLDAIDRVKRNINWKSMKIDLAIILGEITNVIQPLYVPINKLFKLFSPPKGETSGQQRATSYSIRQATFTDWSFPFKYMETGSLAEHPWNHRSKVMQKKKKIVESQTHWTAMKMTSFFEGEGQNDSVDKDINYADNIDEHLMTLTFDIDNIEKH